MPTIPDHLVPLFDSDYKGRPATFLYSAESSRALEKELAASGISYVTRIVKSKKRGLMYCTYLVYGADHGA